tara:strand:+ start:2457 stop:2585 length:129 start_codon:yes stop_codon:yes gene_type:complete
MISRLITEKGINEFLTAVKVLNEKNLDITFTLVGKKEAKYDK